MSGGASHLLRFILGAKSVGFLTLHETEESGYIGSFLVTDLKGIPIEFRCTHLLKPNAVQRSLYGEGLLSYIGVEVCGKPLIRSIKNKPKLIFVDKPFLLKLDEHAPCPTIYVKEFVEGEELPNPGGMDRGFHVEVIESEYDGVKPLEIIKRGELKPKTRELIERFYAELNILEFFERMKRAVESLNRLKSRVK